MTFCNFMKKPGQTPSFFARLVDQLIDVCSLSVGHLKVAVDNDVLEIYFVSKNKDVLSFELAVVGEGFQGKVLMLLKGPKRTTSRGSIPPFPTTVAKGAGKHLQVLARYIRNLASPFDSLAPDVEEAYAAHNTLCNLHYPLLKEKLGFLTFDELVNVYDVHALQMAVVGNMLTNESRIISCDHTKLKDGFVSLKSRNSLLEHEISKLEDNLSKDRKNKMWRLKGLKPHVKETERLEQRCRDLESKRDFLLKEAEKVVDLSLKLKATDLEKIELVKDLLPLAVKRLFESEHFNHALGDLQQKAITFGRSQALDEVHGLGDSWDFKDVEDYPPEAEKIFDEATEAFYKLKFLYISLLVDKAGRSFV
nr:hypothetical protein [Tanacetum cinerariifolium]